jgi:hypothetical protein
MRGDRPTWLFELTDAVGCRYRGARAAGPGRGRQCPAASGRQRHTVAARLLRPTRDHIALTLSDPDVVTAATRSADLLRKVRALPLSLVDHAAAPASTARVNTVTARTDR